MTRAVWDRLLEEARGFYQSHAALSAFAPFPDDIRAQEVAAFDPGCGAHMAATPIAPPAGHAPLTQAIRDAGSSAKWRETYKGTAIAADFMARFGCYNVIGTGGAFTSDKLWMWIVHMPAHLDYPWHQHPGEEIYGVIAGEAIFRRAGMADETLGPGATVRHASNQPHAMETRDQPVLCLVAWRNGFDTPPVWSEGAV